VEPALDKYWEAYPFMLSIYYLKILVDLGSSSIQPYVYSRASAGEQNNVDELSKGDFKKPNNSITSFFCVLCVFVSIVRLQFPASSHMIGQYRYEAKDSEMFQHF
jgi:hypothetical protein